MHPLQVAWGNEHVRNGRRLMCKTAAQLSTVVVGSIYSQAKTVHLAKSATLASALEFDSAVTGARKIVENASVFI